jgi:hypothetical protein
VRYEFSVWNERNERCTIVVDFGEAIPARLGAEVKGKVVEVRREVVER